MKVIHLLATGNNGGIESLMVDIAKYSNSKNVFVFAWGAGECGKKIELQNGTVYSIDGHNIGNFKTIVQILRILKKEIPDAVLIHHSSPLLRIIAILISRKYRTIVYQHNDPFGKMSGNIFTKKLKYLINYKAFMKCDKVIAISHFVKERIIEYYHTPEKKIAVVYNGVDIKKYNRKIHSFDGVVHFFYVGRLIEEKGVQICLKGLSLLPQDLLWDYTIVGDGPYIEDLKILCNEFGLEDKVVFLGDRDDVPDLIERYDVFIHSCICEEGFGISVVEAMAAGKVCVVSDSGALKELIDDGKEGFLVPKNSPEILEQKLLYVINNSKDWENIQISAKKKSQKYNIGVFVESLQKEIAV